MKKLNEKKMTRRTLLAVIMSMCAVGFAFAAGADFASVVAPVVDLLNSLLGPLMLIVGAAGSLYCILLGVKYARAEEPQDREKAKQHLKSAIIGFILIFVLIVVLNLLMGPMMTWVENSTTVDFGAAGDQVTAASNGSSAASSAAGTGTAATPAA